ncbi:hypothetical protein HETIRDRAFT_426267 [Heterobasidion irregulare TC 32-1]|uniref:Uncharacterized protein n=1 Tax=Heterobasidion irregulare (strain TC 32-1) TaxID=747525 RepID=W4KA28_HETIT|nr:uncharacterized protein HETIRDRAFT_426267 [Heterobasidion irregulare TC 32-1]ETW82692.1 hypothetical protein HETIRDRAFT_426267 [Heterobasidion irregulare TC 32-1]
MFAALTCHLVLQWLWVLVLHQSTGSNEPTAPDNDPAEFVASMGSFYLPMINNCALEGIDHVGTQCDSLDISCASISDIHCISTPFGGDFIAFYAIYVLTLATNIIAITLMAVKAWPAQHRRLLRSHLNTTEYRSPALSILALLVESRTLYCVIWIIFLACYVLSNRSSGNAVIAIGETLFAITVQVSVIYPTAVIALAALQETTWDMSVGKDMSQNASHTEMRLVARATCSGTSTTQTGAHRPTPSVDQRSHPHASELGAIDGEL